MRNIKRLTKLLKYAKMELLQEGFAEDDGWSRMDPAAAEKRAASY